jgi:hypothetical protein
VYLNATYLHGRLGRNMQVVSRAVVVAIGINALSYRRVLGIAAGDSEAEDFWRQFLGSIKERDLRVSIDTNYPVAALMKGDVRYSAPSPAEMGLHTEVLSKF